MNNQKIAEEIIRLQDACFCYAKEIIKSKQILLPFAAFLNTSHEITIEDPPHNAKVNKKRIEQLATKIKRLTYSKKIKVGAICFDGILNSTIGKNKEALCIEIHEDNQHSVTNVYYPYAWSENDVLFSEPFSEKE